MQVIKPFLWAELTWEQIRDMQREGVDMVLFPVGSTEQHGPHLPLNVIRFAPKLRHMLSPPAPEFHYC